MSKPLYAFVAVSRTDIGLKSPVVPTRRVPRSSTVCRCDLVWASVGWAMAAAAKATPTASSLIEFMRRLPVRTTGRMRFIRGRRKR